MTYKLLSANIIEEIERLVDKDFVSPSAICDLLNLHDQYETVRKQIHRYKRKKLLNPQTIITIDHIKELADHIMDQEIAFEDYEIDETGFITHFKRCLAKLSTQYQDDPQILSGLSLTYLKLQTYQDSQVKPQDQNSLNITITVNK